MNKKIALKIKYPEFDIESEIDSGLKQELDKVTFDKVTSSNNTRTIRNIRKNLVAFLKSNYGITDTAQLNEKSSQILKIHGLHEDNFDFMKAFEIGLIQKINDVSIDDNANKNEKVMRGYLNEIEKPIDKIIGYDMLYRTMKDLYGRKEAKRLTGEMYSFSLGLSDATNILIPYCWSLDASKLVTVGRDFGILPSKPCKRVSSYISSLCETIHQISNHLAGACLHKDMDLIVKKDNKTLPINIKTLINEFDLNKTYSNYQGDWEYVDISDKNIQVLEDKGKFVKINKLMRRKYNDTIYELTTKSGKKIKCSKDHIFKVMYKGRSLEVKAKDLQQYDTVFSTRVYNLNIDKTSADYKRGQFIGIVVGDGRITQQYTTKIAINYQQTFISDWITKYVKETYNKDISLNKGHGCYDLNINSIDILNDIKKDIVGNNAYDRNVDFNDKSLDYIAGFLDGYLVTNGAYNGGLTITSVNKKLIENVKNVCNYFNVNASNIRLTTKGGYNPDYKGYALQIGCQMLKYLDLMQYKTTQSPKWKRYTNHKSTLDQTAFFGYQAFKNSYDIHTGNKVRSFNGAKFDKYEKNLDVIVDIQQLPNDDEYVYEIETESHWYSVNGLLTHNCAIGSLFLDISHLLIYKERVTLKELKTDTNIRKYVENELQQFIHSVNHLSRNGAESPFTNVSVFDSIKLAGLISKENYGWYFPNLKAISTDNDLADKMSDDNFKKYVIDYIMEVQNLFMDFFEKGDPLQNGMPYRFPVSTINFSKKLNPDTGKYEIEDTEFLKNCCKRDISRFNIFNSEGTKIASCCFKGNEIIEIINENGEITAISLKDFVELYLNKPGRLKLTDKIYIKSMTNDNKLDISRITGVLLKQNGYKQLINIVVGGKCISVTPDHLLKVKHKITGIVSEIKAIDLVGKESEYLLPKIV